MKMVKFLAVAVISASVLSSCSKDDEQPTDEIDPAIIQKAEDFKTFIASKQFQIKSYYSDEPIDYIEDDEEVRSETDLNQYISPWLKDDFNVLDFNNNIVTITQNNIKIDTVPAMPDEFTKSISVVAEKKGPVFNFLNYKYEPLKYYIHEIGTNYFIIYADWHSGEKVFTRFELVEN